MTKIQLSGIFIKISLGALHKHVMLINNKANRATSKQKVY